MAGTPEDAEITFCRKDIRDYLKRSPDDPGSRTSVASFCSQGIGLLSNFTIANYRLRYNDIDAVMTLAEELYFCLDDQSVFNSGFRTKEPFERQNNSILLTPPKRSSSDQPRPETFKGIVYHVSFINPALPRYEYAKLLSIKENDEFGYEDINEGTFKGYNYRNWMFMSLAGLPPQSPLARLFALGLLEDVAKKQAVGAIKTQLDMICPAKPSFAFVPPKEVDQVVANFKQHIAPTQYHFGYLARIKAVEDSIINAQGLVDDQQQLLKDLAFFHRGDLVDGVFTTLLSPIMRSVGELGWDDALAARDFLLMNFKGCFPRWRQADYPEGVTYPDIDSLAKDRRSLAGVPYLYQQLIADRIDSIEAHEKAQRQAAMYQQTEIRERERLERLARKFQWYTLAAVSNAQFPDSQPFNPNRPISKTNPLTLKFKFQVNKPGDKYPTAEKQSLTSQRDNFLIAGIAREISFDYLPFNLLYEGDLTADILRQAFEELKLTERVEETVTPAELFDKLAQPRLAILNRDLARDYGARKENLASKIQLIQNVLEELKKR